MTTRMAGSRVLEADYTAARRVLESGGLTVSQAIQNLMALIARTGEVPKEIANPSINQSREKFDMLMKRVKSRPRIAWPEGVTDEQLLDEERMRRFG